MKRALAWFAGLVGIAALGRTLARRRHASADNGTGDPARSAATEPVPSAAADPAEELRRKLADQRGPGSEPPPEPEPAPAAETLDERRARVHARAREAIDSMHDEGSPT